MSVLSILVLTLVGAVLAPGLSGAGPARPATLEALTFLVGTWDVDMTTFPAAYGDAAGRSDAATECTLVATELRCHTRTVLPDGTPYEVTATVLVDGGGYVARVRNPAGEAAYRGTWRRADTLVFTGDVAGTTQRVLYRDAGPGRVWFYVEESTDGDRFLPHSEAVWTAAGEPWAPPGRDPGRSLTVEALVPGAPDAVAGLFLDPEALNRFMGDTARLGVTPGDPYEVAFLPGSHPGSEASSTAGAEILRHEPGRLLVVEWTAPPWLDSLNHQPLPTWVEISFRAWEDSGATRVRVTHRGFGHGEEWDRLRDFFRASWSSVLFRLQALRWSTPGTS